MLKAVTSPTNPTLVPEEVQEVVEDLVPSIVLKLKTSNRSSPQILDRKKQPSFSRAEVQSYISNLGISCILHVRVETVRRKLRKTQMETGTVKDAA